MRKLKTEEKVLLLFSAEHLISYLYNEAVLQSFQKAENFGKETELLKQRLMCHLFISGKLVCSPEKVSAFYGTRNKEI